jgi:NADH:ubiquinone oxidoreductase subunit 6 (subunit J)
LIVDAAFWTFGVASVVSAWLVFRTDSMVRASFWLLASFLNVGAILLLLGSEYLSMILILMMAGEMAIMAVFMVMFMMNPAGLNPMNMVHQHRVAILAGVLAFLGLAAVGLFGRFPDRPASAGRDVTADLGTELLGNSMMVFESAGAALLATMVASIAIASSRGRYGSADEGSEEPLLGTEVAVDGEGSRAETDAMAGMEGMEGMSS